MGVLAVIPCKTFSTRVPRKNFLEVGGMRLVDRAIMMARQMGFEVVVTTDDKIDVDARTIISDAHFRPMDEHKRSHAVWLEALQGHQGDTVYLEPSSPMRTEKDIEQCVGYGGVSLTVNSIKTVNSTGIEKAFSPNGACYASTGEFLSWRDSLFEGRLYLVETEWRINIDEPVDLLMARAVFGDVMPDSFPTAAVAVH